MAFAAGSDILSDHINEDLAELVSMPAGSHLGRLSVSWLCSDLTEQFVMHYDYDFLYRMKCTLQNMRTRAKYGYPMTAHSVMEKLLLYLCNEEASMLIELNDEINRLKMMTLLPKSGCLICLAIRISSAGSTLICIGC